MAAAGRVRGWPRGCGQQRQPFIVRFGWMWWCFIQINVGIGIPYEVQHVEKPKADGALNRQSTELGNPLPDRFREGWWKGDR